MTIADFVPDIDCSDLEAKYRVEKNEDLNNALVIEGLPKIDASKEDKLLAKLTKDLFAGRSNFRKENAFIPKSEDTGLMKGYMFIEFDSATEADNVMKIADGYRLDKEHVFTAFKLSDFESLLAVDDKFVEPVVEEFHEKDHYKSWLADPLARDQFSVVSGDKVDIFWNHKNEAPEVAYSREKWAENFANWSSKGSFLATFHRPGIAFWGGKNFTKISRISHPGVRLLNFSPCERYVVSWSPENPRKDQNLIVSEVLTGRIFKSFFVAGSTIEWPTMKWSHDGKYLAKNVNDSLYIYELPSMTLLDKKAMKIDDFQDFQWSPKQNIIAYWIPEVENNPARVTLLDIPSKHILRTKNLFNVSNCKLHWQDRGDFLCVKVDRVSKTKKPLCTNFEIFRLREKDIPVDVIECKGQVASFAMEPKGEKFAFIHVENGKNFVSFYEMPKTGNKIQQVTLIKTIERRGVNSLFWSPKGRFLVIASLGVVAASLEFWNMKEVELMSVGEHYMASDVSWDPSGRYVASFVTHWKHQLENGYYIWDFKGQMMNRKSVDRMMHFEWRTRPPTMLSDEKVKDITKNLKDYSKEFEEADSYESNKASREEQQRRDKIISEWKEWKEAKAAEYEETLSLRMSLLGKTSTEDDDETFFVEEWVEEVIEEKEEIINE